ncbi:hypothetical protein LOK49_LG02G02435 [Camellia lanceoleosa]|uniref:Uncharacterized protein n=1 Tax=Camellia lanceoleosa TaxID=1840588 RepID=A0ACC0IVR2_9ERIC|nr:hypothetical protein LOK49_LG02G02435 [Camellia lanceoleosa]
MCSGLSSVKDDVDDECALQWAAIERLPTFERLRSSSFDENDGSNVDAQGKRVVDVTKLGALERNMFIDKLIKHIENDNLRLLHKLRKRIDKEDDAINPEIIQLKKRIHQQGSYEIMRNYMPKVGSLGLNLTCIEMKQIATSLFANSPFTEGKPNGYLSKRRFEQYVDYALDVSMYFIYRKNKYIDCTGMSFQISCRKTCFNSCELPTLNDWENHPTTIFRVEEMLGDEGLDGDHGGGYVHYLRFGVGVKLLIVEVRYNNLRVEAECEVVHGKPLPTLWNSLKSILFVIMFCGGGAGPMLVVKVRLIVVGVAGDDMMV